MEDLISRQSAIDALILEGRSVDSRYISAERIIHESDAIEAISMLPSAESTGKWVDDCACSICHWIHEDNKGFALITKYNFCPNCGAKMEVEDE